MNLNDFESAAEKMVPPRAYAYFHSAADDLRSLRNNKLDWEKVTLRPRVLRNVARVNMGCTMMGQRSRLPIFIAPAARARMAHDDGELCLARGAARRGIPYCVSSYSSVAHEDLISCVKEEKKGEGGCLFFQLYIQKTRAATEALIKMARDLGFEALVVTVDTPIVGKREEDERFVAQVAIDAGEDLASSVATNPALSGENAPILRGVHSATFSWDDLKWVRQVWGPKPMVLKGIQTAEDALFATGVGVEGIYLSNHGGRQIDDGPSSIRTLLEIHKFCPEVLQKVEIYLDGSVRRGTDVLKALCLGAKGIAIGRTFMYALGTHGTQGVEKAIQSLCSIFIFPVSNLRAPGLPIRTVLSEEIECTMRLMGVTDFSQLSPEYLNYSILEQEMPNHLTAFRKQMGSKL